MATVTITFTDTDTDVDNGNVQIELVSNPPISDDSNSPAQHLGSTMLELLNEWLQKRAEKAYQEDECCHHEGCGCHEPPTQENLDAFKKKIMESNME